MLKLDIGSNGVPIIIQTVTSPTVYLDVCILTNIALKEELRKKFLKILTRKRGTLLFSWMHLFEFSHMTDKKQTESIESFLDSLLDNLGFIDVIPKIVIEKENKLLQGDKNVNPLADERFLSFLGSTVMINKKSIIPISFRGLLTKLNNPIIINMKKEFHLKFEPDIKKLQEKKQKDKSYAAKVIKASAKNFKIATRYIYADIFNSFIRENHRVPSSNDWRDFYHTVVPIAYCDYVLLDRGFAHRAQSTIDRLKQNKYFYRIGKVYSKIDKFLIDFNAVDASSKGTTLN